MSFMCIIIVILFAIFVVIATTYHRIKIVHIVRPGVDVRVVRNLFRETQLAYLAQRVPDRSTPQRYPLSFEPVGERLGRQWNTPADETYWRHGVLVDQPPRQHYDWIATPASEAMGLPLRVAELRFKSHTARSPGVWLHTDRRMSVSRDVLLLLYLSDVDETDGGTLHVFEHGPVVPDAARVEAYQSGVRVKQFDGPLVTAGIGGEWQKGERTFVSALRVTPARGTAVLMDCRQVDNVHAVTEMHTNAPRHLAEIWLAAA